MARVSALNVFDGVNADEEAAIRKIIDLHEEVHKGDMFAMVANMAMSIGAYQKAMARVLIALGAASAEHLRKTGN
jgi:hypothetical protein